MRKIKEQCIYIYDEDIAYKNAEDRTTILMYHVINLLN